jgi:hypothetical protein
MEKSKSKGVKKNTPAKAKAKKVKSPKAPVLSGRTSLKAIVVETPKEGVFDSPSNESSQAPLVVPVAIQEPDTMDILAKSLNKSIKSYGKPMTKRALEDFLNLMPQSAPYVIPRYGEKSYTIEISDGTKKVTIPSTGSYPLAI